MNESEVPQHCARCGKVAPDQESEEFLTWEPIDDEGERVVCEDCLTGEEQQSIDEDTVITSYEAELDNQVWDPLAEDPHSQEDQNDHPG